MSAKNLLMLAISVLLSAAMGIGQSTQVPRAGRTGAVRVITPGANAKLTANVLTAKWEMLAPASAADSPTFELRLDAQDPIHTTDTEYTFSGMAPGAHVLTIQAVDANNTPIPGTRAETHFTVPRTNSPPPTPR
jgi:hypothetical protein